MDLLMMKGVSVARRADASILCAGTEPDKPGRNGYFLLDVTSGSGVDWYAISVSTPSRSAYVTV